MLGAPSRSRASRSRLANHSSASGATVGAPNTSSNKNAVKKSQQKGEGASRSRSTNQVGVGYSFQIILPDGTNVTPRPLLPGHAREGMVGEDIPAGASRSVISTSSADAALRSGATAAAGNRRSSHGKGGAQKDPLAAQSSSSNNAAGGRGRHIDKGGYEVNANNTNLSTSIIIEEPPHATNNNQDGDGLGNLGSPSADPARAKNAKGMAGNKAGGKAAGRAAAVAAQEDDGHVMEPVRLSETATTLVLNLPGLVVAQDARERAEVEGRNTRLHQMLENRASSSDLLEARHSQTINLVQKHKEIQAARPAVRECGCQASVYDIHDEYSNRLVEAGSEWDAPADQQQAAQQAAQQMQSTGALVDGHGLLASITSNTNLAAKRVEEYVKVALASRGCLLEVEGGPSPSSLLQQGSGLMDDDARAILVRQACQRILTSAPLQHSLTLVERAIKQNLFHGAQLRYRNLLPTEEADTAAERRLPIWDDDASEGSSSLPDDASWNSQQSDNRRQHFNARRNSRAARPAGAGGAAAAAGAGGKEGAKLSGRVEVLWAFDCALTAGRVVNSMCWCHGKRGAARHDLVTRDLLAVGYSSCSSSPSVLGPPSAGSSSSSSSSSPYLSSTGASDGLVLFWSLRNPHHPERTLRVSSGVTALSFSAQHPNLLAVGLVDGSISIFDLHKDDEQLEPILDTSTLPGRHSAPVWQVKWVDKGSDQAEGLVSISTDGRVMEWSTSKGLSACLLMELKRIGNNLQGKISNQAAGLSFDFVHGDPSLYVVSTEDGLIYKCSVSYNEQYLETYLGHTAPVYRVACSPYYPSAFLSCGGDWTVKLWSLKDVRPVASFQTLDLSAMVHDVAWSPHSSTVFASVTGDARLMVWDLSQSVIDPVIVEPWAPPADSRDNNTGGTSGSDGSAAGINTGGSAAGLARGADSSSNMMGPETPPSDLMGGGQTTLMGGSSTGLGLDGSGGASALRRTRPEYTSVLFYPDTPVLAVGDSHGLVTCYRIVDLFSPAHLHKTETAEQQADRLRQAMFPERK